MKIFVSGSLAYDIILDYRGRFADHISPEKIHVLSLSFLVSNVRRSMGGTAGNIVYNLAILGLRVKITAAIGNDGQDILRKLKQMRVNTENLKFSEISTAAAYIITDSMDNQNTGFYPGAMEESVKLPKASSNDWAIIAAENPQNMARLARYYKKNKIKYLFDPGQAITALSKSQMRGCVKGAAILIGNDYEIGYVMDYVKPKCTVIKTYGPKGSEIIYPSGQKTKIGVAKVSVAVDPTGAGDAYRAGLLCGIVKGFDLQLSCQLGAAAASFAVETYGTQNHRFTYDILKKRHNKNFKAKIQ